ncbi:MAG: FtsX-like permease family protein [Hyphomicrobiaceae bacterium]|nr:MAG: FtsX-like permease family protein [Hyphomicrobiaceae bacterium]
MTLTLAFRNLFHDRVRLAVTLVGILFSIVLVAVQLGLYLGARTMIISMIDRADGDLWIMAYGTKNFEEAQPISAREKYAALATPGVARAIPLVASFTDWRKPTGGSTLVVVIGAEYEDRGLAPWNVVEGDVSGLGARDAVMVDKTYLAELGLKGVGDTAQIGMSRVRVTGLTEGIRSFTVTPYIFTTLTRAKSLLDMPADNITYVLVKLQPGADPVAVRDMLKVKVPDSEVLTRAEFRERSLNHWLFATGAGVALIGGAILGLVVGTVIVAQTLYSSTKDHLNEFATLRALGSSSGYIHRVILAQAGLSAVLGYALGMAIALAIVYLSEHTALPILMTPALAALLLVLTIAMCAISAISAIGKVMRIDPAMVFNR